jgi:O-antigen/teichoic acid export membrane protein
MLGVWMILTLVPVYAEALGRSKTDLAAVYVIGNDKFKTQDVVASLNLIATLSSILLVAIITLNFNFFYNFLFKSEIYNYRSEFYVLLIQIPLQFFFLNYSYIHIAIDRIGTYNKMIIANAWVSALISIPLLVFTPLGLWSVILGMELGTFIALIYGIYSASLNNLNKGRPSKKIVFDLLQYGFHFYLSGIFGQINQTGARLLAVYILPPFQIAFLGQAQILGQIFNKVPDAASTILYQHVSHSKGSDSLDVCLKVLRISVVVSFVCSLIAAVFAKPAIILFYGKEFSPVVNIFYYLLPGLFVSGLIGPIIGYFNGVGSAKIIPRVQFIAILIQLALVYICLGIWGLSGVAIAISVGQVLYGLFLCLAFIRISSANIWMLLPKKSDFITLFLSIKK